MMAFFGNFVHPAIGSKFASLAIFLIVLVVKTKSQESPVVNILLIYQEDESIKYFDAAKEFVERNPSLSVRVGTVHRFFSNGTEPLKLSKQFCEEMERIMAGADRPDIALDFTRIGIPSEAVKVVLRSMQMPTIAATFGQEGDVREWREMSAEQQKYMIQISPPADVLVQSVRSIVDMQNMTSAVVLFDDQYEMYHKYKSLLQNLPTRHLLTKVEKSSNLMNQISKLVHVDIVNFFIAATIPQISEVLAQASYPAAKDGPYFSDEYAWYSMHLGEGTPTCSHCELNVTLVHLSPELPKEGEMKRNFLTGQLGQTSATLTELFYFDVSLDAILAVGDMKSKQKWVHDISNNTCSAYKMEKPYPELDLDLFSFFETASMENSLGSKFIMEGNGKNYPKFEMKIRYLKYKPNEAVPHYDDTIGVWNSGYGESLLLNYYSNKTLIPHLAEIVFRIVTVVQPPFVYAIPDCDPKKGKYENCFRGYCIELLKKIQEELKFKFTIKAVDGYGYMAENPPHEWNGIVAELKERRADIGLGAMSVMAERESVVDFTVPYYDLVGISILMKKPKAQTSLFKFLTVLENDVWMCILGAYFFTSFLMWIFDRWSPYSYQNNREKYEEDEEKREFNLKECLWFCMTSLTPQGGGEAPKNLSGRLVAATWWLFGFIIIASYTANLAAFLTVSRLDTPIESLDDLSKQYKVQYAPLNGSSAWVYFDRMAHIEHRFYEIWKDMSLNDSMTDFERSQLAVWDYPVSDKFTKMWQAMLENDPPKTFDEAINRVRGGLDKDRKEIDQFAFLDEATNIKYQTTISCEFDMKGEEFSRKPYAIAVQKGSPLKESFSHMILKLLNQRYLEQLKEQWWNDNPDKKECPRDDNQSDGISIHNIGGVFIVIFVGIVMACFTLIFEYWWYRKRDVAEEMAEMALPPPKEFAPSFNAEKTNFNTQYNKQVGARSDLPSIENSW